ncbi:MAG: PTS sugar transporter subunit IIA [Magnetococcales bacterium]|nr:PTS sugar transporter subunit IIA [Magnetococcales bacterium]
MESPRVGGGFSSGKRVVVAAPHGLFRGGAMMRVRDLLSAERVKPALESVDKLATLREMAFLLAAGGEVEFAVALEALLERERLGSTGVGRGVAIPHGKVEGLTAPLAALGRSTAGIPFDALDGQPVHLVMALLSPMEPPELHLQALAAISRLLREEAAAAQLLRAPDAQALFQRAAGG